MRRLVFIGLTLLAGCAHAPSRGPKLETVRAEGWSPADKNDPLAAKRRALAEAQRAAIEKVTGVEVSARTRVSQAVTVEQRITSRATGTIRSYEVLGESESDGFHKTRIRAVVEVGNSTKTKSRPEAPPGDPKVSVLLKGEDSAGALGGVRRALIGRGFTVTEGGNADITVSGDVTVATQPPIAGFASCRSRVALEARRVRTGEVLWQSSREASAVDPGLTAACSKSAETAGLLGAEIMAQEVAARLAE